MNEQEKTRLYDICYRSKRDGKITQEDQRFLMEMFGKYHDEYVEIQRRAAGDAVGDFKKGCGA